jgi:hypothetical protein
LNSALVEVDIVHAVGCQAAARRVITQRIDIGQTVPIGQCNDEIATAPSASTSYSSSLHLPDRRLMEARLSIS